MVCKDCISFSRCKEMYEVFGVYIDLENSVVCKHFKNKTDFVKAVRCKDCKFRGTEDCSTSYYLEYEGAYADPMEDDDFCSYGAPKERGEEK